MIDGDHPLARWITAVTVDGKKTYATEVYSDHVIAPTWYGFDSNKVRKVELTETVYEIYGKVRLIIDPQCPISVGQFPEIASMVS